MFLASTRSCLWFQWNRKYLSSAFLRLRCRMLIAPWHGFHMFENERSIRPPRTPSCFANFPFIFVAIWLLFQIFCQHNRFFYICYNRLSWNISEFLLLYYDLNFTASWSYKGNLEDIILLILSHGVFLAWFSMLDMNIVSIILSFLLWNDVISWKFCRQYQPRTWFPRKPRKLQELVIFKAWIFLLCHKIWWEAKLEAMQMRDYWFIAYHSRTVKNAVKNTSKQNSKIEPDQQWVKRKKLFYFENALSFTNILIRTNKVDKVFLAKQQSNLMKTW